MYPELKSIIEFITEFGVLVLIAAIFLYAAIRAINLLFDIVTNKVSVKKQHTDHDKLLDIRSQVSREITQLLDEFIEAHGGGRVQVMEFSNSVTSVAYLPFKYMTCTYEVYEFGMAPSAHKIDHLSTSLFTKFFTTLCEKKVCLLDASSDSHKIGGAAFEVMREIGEKQFLCSILRSGTGKHIGFICMSKNSGFTEQDIKGIQILADRVSVLLGVADN